MYVLNSPFSVVDPFGEAYNNPEDWNFERNYSQAQAYAQNTLEESLVNKYRRIYDVHDSIARREVDSWLHNQGSQYHPDLFSPLKPPTFTKEDIRLPAWHNFNPLSRPCPK